MPTTKLESRKSAFSAISDFVCNRRPSYLKHTFSKLCRALGRRLAAAPLANSMARCRWLAPISREAMPSARFDPSAT